MEVGVLEMHHEHETERQPTWVTCDPHHITHAVTIKTASHLLKISHDHFLTYLMNNSHSLSLTHTFENSTYFILVQFLEDIISAYDNSGILQITLFLEHSFPPASFYKL